MLASNITSYEDLTDDHRSHVEIISNTLYRHKTLELTYTTYDMQEDKDTLYQRKSPDIMVHSDDQEHPYLYGRVLDLFHIDVKNRGPDSLLPNGETAILPLAWIRWFRLDTSLEPCGFSSLRYPMVSFYESHEADAFGLIHPDEIIRSAHLIPHFRSGLTGEYLNVRSRGRPVSEDMDWKHFNINM